MGIFLEPIFTRYYQTSPLVLVDAGANGGIGDHLKRAEKYLRVIGFEPEPDGFRELEAKKNPHHTFFNIAVLDKKSTVDFYVTQKRTASSIFKPNMAFRKPFQQPDEFNIVRTLKLNTDSLDNIGRDNNIADIDLMKLDTQGSELLILKGAAHYLEESIFGIEVEVEFAPLYVDQPLFSEIDTYLLQKGFALFNLGLVRWQRRNASDKMTKGQLATADALYFKKAEHVVKLLDRFKSVDEKKAKIAKAVSVCLLYGHADYALELISLVPDLFTQEEQRTASAMIRKKMSRRWMFPDFRGRWALARLIYRIWSIIEPSHNRWNSFDNNLSRL